ncbi:MAG: sensor histidine kinase [Hyalangium sp.]|uniref:sensor histidine kinase n=1 Tax=Hyalangium sp. TaxID=2028555 RepID=UPI00389AE498
MLDTPPQASILLVDDLPSNLIALEALLAPFGYRLVRAASGHEALRCTLQEDFAVILLDVRLGDMSGIEVTAMLRDRERTRHTPVLLMTAANSDDRERLEGYAHGAVDYLRKPLVPEVLRAKVAVFVDLYRARESLRRHEELLRAREREALENAHRERLHHLLIQAPAAITILRGAELVYEFANPLYETIIGRPVTLGKPLREVVPELAAQPQVLERLRHVLETGEPFDGTEISMKWDRHGTGELVEGFFNIFYQPVRDDRGRISGVLTFSVEVTEQVLARRKAESLAEDLNQLNSELERRVRERTAQLQEANHELESFSYSVSHDLRAPLRHITGFAQLLARKVGPKLDDASRGYLDTIISAAQQGGTLIDDLLSFSRMSRAELRKRPVDLRALMEEVRRELASDASGRHVEWRIGELPQVEADPALLRQVARNLLGNALKYTRPRPHAVIEVGAHPVDNDVEVWVRDNGVGFEMQYVDKLFGVFQRLHTHDEFEGTGIGLANVRRIISRHGGRTWAEGALGQGATFHFSLPRARLETKDDHRRE